MRRALLVALLVLLAAVPAAQARPGQESVFQDDNLLMYRGDAVSDRTFDELKALGVDRVRLSVPWRVFAPRIHDARKPRVIRYRERDFHPWDHALRAAKARGIEVLMNVTGGAPLWATGRRNGRPVSRQYKPDADEFARFVAMLGRRWDGRKHPRATAWSIWNEPNYGAFLQPQWEDGRATSPAVYRRLVRGALRGLRASGHGRDLVLLGETAPVGVERRGAETPMRPARFLRELLCLDDDLLPAAGRGCDFARKGRFDVTGYAHHPYPIVSPPQAPSENRDDLRLADIGRLERLLDAAAGAGRIPPQLSLWFTEFGYQTPPDPERGIPLDQHAAWLAQAEHATFRNPRVAAHAQFQLLDDPPRTHLRRSDPRYWGTYQAGLRFADGRRKPAWEAYRLVLHAPARVARGRPLTLFGLVRAARNGEDQRVQFEFRAPGSDAWVPAGGPIAVTGVRGHFEVDVPVPRSGFYRYSWRGARSAAVGVYVE